MANEKDAHLLQQFHMETAIFIRRVYNGWPKLCEYSAMRLAVIINELRQRSQEIEAENTILAAEGLRQLTEGTRETRDYREPPGKTAP